MTLPAPAEVYTWRDENGVAHFSDHPPNPVGTHRHPEVTNIEVPEISTVSARQLPEQIPKQGNPSSGSTRQKVVIYSASWCGACKQAKRYFERHKIDYRERDIEKSKSARVEFERLGGRGVPLILVGRKRLQGFTEASFEQINKP